jgi:hypothetical protein
VSSRRKAGSGGFTRFVSCIIGAANSFIEVASWVFGVRYRDPAALCPETAGRSRSLTGGLPQGDLNLVGPQIPGISVLVSILLELD